MKAETVTVAVQILGKEYRVACEVHERDALLASAHYLNDKLREIRDSGKVIGLERTAVMAALNMANELLEQRARKEDYMLTMGTKVRALQDKIEAALTKGRQMEI
ncbi:MAG: cell division protein ZapA [Proteobacteria bacterium]|nr:cell division protein ZapA [Pseudomonadota bacterium]